MSFFVCNRTVKKMNCHGYSDWVFSIVYLTQLFTECDANKCSLNLHPGWLKYYFNTCEKWSTVILWLDTIPGCLS